MLKHLTVYVVLCCAGGCAAEHVSETEAALAAPPARPKLAYSSARPSEADSYPRLPTLAIRVYDTASIAYLATSPLVKYQLTYQPLSNGSGPVTMTPIELEVVGVIHVIDPPTSPPIGPAPPPPPPPPLPTMRTIRIDANDPARGLVRRSVYRMKIQLFDLSDVALGPQSDWFYSVTAGTSADPSTTLNWGRVDMVLQGLVQLGDAEDGLIGPGGTVAPDGTRFVSVDHPHYNAGDEIHGWCDWFYHYLGVRVTDGLDGSIALDPVVDGGNLFWQATMNPNNVPNAFRDPLDDGCGTALVDVKEANTGDALMEGCQKHTATEVDLDLNDNRFYSNIPDNIYYDAIKSLPQNQAMGNYQAMDIHAGMFIAFDPGGDGTSTGAGTIGTVWSLEGNVSDSVKIMHRAADNDMINGFGKLTEAMFAP